MGRIVDLCGEIAAAAEEGAEGLVLAPADWERLGEQFTDDEIEDALSLVHESLAQSELVDAADSLSGRVLQLLSSFAAEDEFARASAGDARLTLETIAQLARRVERMEEILGVFREDAPPNRTRFDALRRRLLDRGLEAEMASDPADDLPEEADDEEE